MASLVPPAVVLFAVALVVALAGRRLGHAVGLVGTAAVIPWLLSLPAGTHLTSSLLTFQLAPVAVDTVSRFVGVTFALVTALIVAFSYGSGRTSRQTALGIAYAGTGLGVVFAGDWLTLLFFWELMAVGSLLLVWSAGGPAVRAGFRYGVFHGVGGVLLILAVALQYVAVGSFALDAHAGLAAGAPAVLGTVAIGVNAAFVGLHTWLPDAYPGADPVVSVVLCGYTTKAAVYALYRAVPDGHLLVAYMGGTMAIFGVTYALLQTDMRRLLSYHVQSQVGYMVAGVGLGSSLGVAGGFFHLLNNVLYKSLLFMVAGVIIARTGRGDLKRLGGLHRAMPLTFVVFAVGALSIVGVPGFNGYVSKAMVKSAATKEHLVALKWLFTVAGLGTAMSFAKFGYYAFFHGEHGGEVADATAWQTLAMGTVAVLCLLFGVLPGVVYGILPGLEAAAPTPYAAEKVLEATALALGGGAAFFAIRGPLGRVRGVPDVDRVYNPVAFYGLRGLVNGVVTAARRLDAIATGLAAWVRSAATSPRDVRAPLVDTVPGIDREFLSADVSLALLTIVVLATALLVLL